MHRFILFQILLSYRLSQNIESSSWCYTVDLCWLSVLYMVVCVCHSQDNLGNFKKFSNFIAGCGGLVAKLCPTLVTPWTVACQTPRRKLRVSDWTILSFKQEGCISQTSNNTSLGQRSRQLVRCGNRRKDQFCEISKTPKECNSFFNFLSFISFSKFPK